MALLMVVLGVWPLLAASQDIVEVSAEGVKAILDQPEVAMAGARHPDVTMVEYFDYNCGYCKKLIPILRVLLAEDPKLAIVYKDWPIFGGSSVYAARCAVAAQWQGKYLIAHDALMKASRVSEDAQVDAILGGAGVDVVRLQRDLKTYASKIAAILLRNDSEAKALELQGTPGIMIGRQLMPGGAELPVFRQLIAAARLSK